MFSFKSWVVRNKDQGRPRGQVHQSLHGFYYCSVWFVNCSFKCWLYYILFMMWTTLHSILKHTYYFSLVCIVKLSRDIFFIYYLKDVHRQVYSSSSDIVFRYCYVFKQYLNTKNCYEAHINTISFTTSSYCSILN